MAIERVDCGLRLQSADWGFAHNQQSAFAIVSRQSQSSLSINNRHSQSTIVTLNRQSSLSINNPHPQSTIVTLNRQSSLSIDNRHSQSAFDIQEIRSLQSPICNG